MERLREHSYAKHYENDTDESAMETTTTPTSSVANADDIIVNVTQLDKDSDTFESLLLELLKSYSLEQHPDNSSNSQTNQIIPEALDTLSSEQINRIITSSSVHYQSIQHVLKMKKEAGYLAQIPDSIDSVGIISEISGHSPLSDHSPSLSTSNEQFSLTSNSNASTNGTTDTSTNSAVAVTSPGGKSSSISIKISPEQLKNLQSQITEMFKKQNLRLPDGLSGEQQQLVLNSLIAQQLNATLQQLIPGVNSRPTKSNSGCVSDTTPTASSKTGSDPLSTVNAGTPPSTGPLNSISNITTKTVNKTDELPIRKKKDPDSKRPPTAFNLFFSEMYPSVQEQQPNISFSEASKMVSGLWSGLGQDGKKKYYDKCEQVRNEFNTRIKEAPPTEDALDNVSVRTMRKQMKKEEREKEEGMCVSNGCYNMAVTDRNRGLKYCSNECVVNHSKILFHGWITQRRLKT